MRTIRYGLRNTITLAGDIIFVVGLAVMLIASAFDTIAKGLNDEPTDQD